MSVPHFERESFYFPIEQDEIKLVGDSANEKADSFLNHTFVNQRVLLRNIPLNDISNLLGTAQRNSDLRFMVAASMDILSNRFEKPEPQLGGFLTKCLKDEDLPEVLKMRVSAYFFQRIPTIVEPVKRFMLSHQKKTEQARAKMPGDLDQIAELVALGISYKEVDQPVSPANLFGRSAAAKFPMELVSVQPPGVTYWNKLTTKAETGEDKEALETCWSIVNKIAQMDPLICLKLLSEWRDVAQTGFRPDAVDKKSAEYSMYRIILPTVNLLTDESYAPQLRRLMAPFITTTRMFEPLYYSQLVTDNIRSLPLPQVAQMMTLIHEAENVPLPQNTPEITEALKEKSAHIAWITYPPHRTALQPHKKYLICQYLPPGLEEAKIVSSIILDRQGRRFPTVINKYGERRSADYLEHYFRSRYENYDQTGTTNPFERDQSLNEKNSQMVARFLVEIEDKRSNGIELSDADQQSLRIVIEKIRNSGDYFLTMPLIIGLFHVAPSEFIDNEQNRLIPLLRDAIDSNPWLDYSVLTEARRVIGHNLNSDGIARIRNASQNWYEHMMDIFKLLEKDPSAEEERKALIYFQYDFYTRRFALADVWEEIEFPEDLFAQNHKLHREWLERRAKETEKELAAANGPIDIIRPIIENWDRLSDDSKRSFADYISDDTTSAIRHIINIANHTADSEYLTFISDSFLPWVCEYENGHRIIASVFKKDFDDSADLPVYEENRRIDRNVMARRIIGFFIDHWNDLSEDTQSYFIDEIHSKSGFLRSHWAQIARNIGETNNLAFVTDHLIPWTTNHPNAEILLAGLFTPRLYKPVPPEAGQINRSYSDVAREIWQSLIQNWNNFGDHREYIYTNAIENEGSFHGFLLNFSQHLDTNYDLVIQNLLPLAFQDGEAGAILHFILANSPTNTPDLEAAKEMVIETAFKAISLPTYPQLANFHQMVSLLDGVHSQNRFIAMYNGVPSIYEHLNLSHYPGKFPLEYDHTQGKIVFPGIIVEENQDSEFYPLNERIDRVFQRAEAIQPGLMKWLEAKHEEEEVLLREIRGATVVPLPPMDVAIEDKKLISLLNPQGTHLDPTTERLTADYPVVDLFLGKEISEARIEGNLYLTDNLSLRFGLTAEGYTFPQLAALGEYISFTNMERLSSALTAKIHEEIISANILRRDLEHDIRSLPEGKPRPGDQSIPPSDVDVAYKGYEDKLTGIKLKYNFYAGNQLRRWVDRGFVVLATDNPFVDCLDPFCDEASEKGMSAEELLIHFMDDISERTGKKITKLYIGRPVTDEEMSKHSRTIKEVPQLTIDAEIIDMKAHPKDWILPFLRIYTTSDLHPQPQQVRLAQQYHWNPLSFYVLERSGQSFLPPRTILSTFVSPRKKTDKSITVFEG